VPPVVVPAHPASATINAMDKAKVATATLRPLSFTSRRLLKDDRAAGSATQSVVYPAAPCMQ
jgi:hypothetical protein